MSMIRIVGKRGKGLFESQLDATALGVTPEEFEALDAATRK